jgi:predicted Zn-ribbon and HTH transcriptional regulator
MKTRLFENLIKSVRDMVDDLTFDDLIRIVASIKDLFYEPPQEVDDMLKEICNSCGFEFYYQDIDVKGVKASQCPACGLHTLIGN